MIPSFIVQKGTNFSRGMGIVQKTLNPATLTPERGETITHTLPKFFSSGKLEIQ